MRARKNYYGPIKNIGPNPEDANESIVTKALSAMVARENPKASIKEDVKKGKNAKKILSDKLKGYRGLELQGVNSDEIIYYVSSGSTVMAMTGGDNAVLVVGYDAQNIYVYNPANGVTSPMSFDTANGLFANGSYSFVTYITV